MRLVITVDDSRGKSIPDEVIWHEQPNLKQRCACRLPAASPPLIRRLSRATNPYRQTSAAHTHKLTNTNALLEHVHSVMQSECRWQLRAVKRCRDQNQNHVIARAHAITMSGREVSSCVSLFLASHAINTRHTRHQCTAMFAPVYLNCAINCGFYCARRH